jgi:hypothetical protein
MDIHKEYIKDGEIIYAPKVDSLSLVAGRERILFNFWLYNSPNVRTVDIYWDGRKDSMIIPVSPSSERDSLSVILPNLVERSYTFDVRTTDNYGHKSLWTTDFGSVYGATYESTLSQRRVRDLVLTDKSGTINWFAGGSGLVRVETRYRNKAGATVVVHTQANENTTVCPDAAPNSTFEYRSLFIPEEHSIDTFALAWTTAEEPFPNTYRFDRSDWVVLSVSDETASDGGGKNTLIDDDLGTFWHSQWEGGEAPLPHWAIIDLNSPKKFIRIETYRRRGNTNSKTIQYFVGDDPDPESSGWVQIAEGAFTSGDKVTIDIPASVATDKGRYLKIYLPDSNRTPLTSIAEIYLYGN